MKKNPSLIFFRIFVTGLIFINSGTALAVKQTFTFPNRSQRVIAIYPKSIYVIADEAEDSNQFVRELKREIKTGADRWCTHHPSKRFDRASSWNASPDASLGRLGIQIPGTRQKLFPYVFDQITCTSGDPKSDARRVLDAKEDADARLKTAPKRGCGQDGESCPLPKRVRFADQADQNDDADSSQEQEFNPDSRGKGAAGGLIYTQVKDRNNQLSTYVLLGKEKYGADKNTWCMMMGSVDIVNGQRDTYLNTALHEIFEESAEVYQVDRKTLKNSSFTVIQEKGKQGSGQNIVTYFVNLPFKPGKTFRDALQSNSLGIHSKEMSDYTWVKLDDLKNALTKTPIQITSQHNGRQIVSKTAQFKAISPGDAQNGSIKNITLRPIAYKILKQALNEGHLDRLNPSTKQNRAQKGNQNPQNAPSAPRPNLRARVAQGQGKLNLDPNPGKPESNSDEASEETDEIIDGISLASHHKFHILDHPGSPPLPSDFNVAPGESPQHLHSKYLTAVRIFQNFVPGGAKPGTWFSEPMTPNLTRIYYVDHDRNVKMLLVDISKTPYGVPSAIFSDTRHRIPLSEVEYRLRHVVY